MDNELVLSLTAMKYGNLWFETCNFDVSVCKSYVNACTKEENKTEKHGHFKLADCKQV